MSHEITALDKGVFHRPAWHGLLKVSGQFMTTEECIRESGLYYEHSLQQVFALMTKEIQSPEGVCYGTQPKAIPGKYAVVRDDIDEPIAVVGERYRIIQNTEMFTALDGLTEHGAKFASAFTTHGGTRVHMLVSMPGAKMCGEDYEQWILATNSHDGSTKFQLMPTSVRVVCANTVSAAIAMDGHHSIKIRHTAQAHGKVNRLTGLLANAQADYSRIKAMFEYADSYSSSKDELVKAGRQVWGEDSRSAEQKIDGLIDSWDHPTNQMLGDTRYRGIQAITHYVDHWDKHISRGKTKHEAAFNRATAVNGDKKKLVEAYI